jgi:CO/xanthine dehydrogenase FAD-binding subunit
VTGLRINEYIKPGSVGEAYEILSSKPDSVVIGGGAYIRLSERHVGTAIDLCNAGLSYIKETEDCIEIGAMTTLREIEKSSILSKYFDGILVKAAENVVGVQLRNVVTIGGGICGKYGFSHLATALLALNAKVVFYKNGKMPLEEYLNKGHEKDILEKIVLAKNNMRAAFTTVKYTSIDFPILNAAVSKLDGKYRIAVGGRPGIATLAYDAMKFMNENGSEEGCAQMAGKIAGETLSFSSDVKASAEYRIELCPVLVKRAILEVK